MAKSRALKVLQAPCPQPPYRHQDPHMSFPSSELIFTDSRSTSIVGGWPTWHTHYNLTPRNATPMAVCISAMAAGAGWKSLKPISSWCQTLPPKTKLGKCVITKQGFLDTLYILTFFSLFLGEGKARQPSKRDAWSPSETQDHNARSHLHLLAYTVQDHLLRFELSLSNSFPPLSKLPRPPNIANFNTSKSTYHPTMRTPKSQQWLQNQQPQTICSDKFWMYPQTIKQNFEVARSPQKVDVSSGAGSLVGCGFHI